jgi:hypothetical protein
MQIKIDIFGTAKTKAAQEEQLNKNGKENK